MKEENEITQEVRDLLDSLEQHGQNARRQKELSDLIDSLAGKEKLAEANYKHRKLYPLWWIVGAAAACLLLWLLTRPALKETPNMNEEILVEKTGAKDTMATQEEIDFIEESVILEEPVPEQLLAEETPIKTKKTQTISTKPTSKTVEENDPEPQLDENHVIESTKTETIDTSNIGFNPITVIEEPIAVQSPQRRVIRSLNLVCYECQKEPEYLTKTNYEDKTIFGQPQDPNMKNGSLAFELKLH
jgi:hypothetical protein